MFDGASSFDQDLSKWDVVSSGIHFNYMFRGASSFNQNLCNWSRLHIPVCLILLDATLCVSPAHQICVNIVEIVVLVATATTTTTMTITTTTTTNIFYRKVELELELELELNTGMDDDITVFAPLDMVDDNIHQATDDDSPVTVQQTHRRW